MSSVTIATTTDTSPQGVTKKVKAEPNQQSRAADSASSYGDWRDDLARDGYAVIKGAIPRERAEKYADAMYSWLEGL